MRRGARPNESGDGMTSNNQKHQAGRHFAVAEALLRGYPASMQGAQTYIQVNGHTAAVQVAGQGVWMIADVEKFANMTTETYVLVDVTGGKRDFYVVPGEELRHGVRQRHQEFMDKHGGTRPRNPDSKHAAVEPIHVETWRDRWSLFDGKSEG